MDKQHNKIDIKHNKIDIKHNKIDIKHNKIDIKHNKIDIKHNKSNNDALLIAPQDHGYFMCIMASLFLISGIYAFTRGNYEFAIGPLGVWINSVNYWRKPTYGLRRNIDICWVLFALTCTAFNAYKSIHGLTWTYIMFSSLLVFYPLGWLLYMYEYFWLATIAHSMLHVLPNLANVILYSGLSCETS